MKLYTTEELCELMHRDRRYIKQLRDSGLLIGVKFGKGWLYRESDVNGMFERFKGQEINNYADMVLLAQTHKKRVRT